MLADEEGFLRPHVDDAKCVGCGLCHKVCVELDRRRTNEAPQVFAAWSKNRKIRQQSTSGGVFSELAKCIIEKGGVVFGAAFDPFPNVRHIAISDGEKISRFRGSKYVQSELRFVYREVKSILQSGRIALFSGTPCQVAGLYAYLGERHEGKLFTVDLVCHGVSSPLVFQKYITFVEEQYKSKVSNYLFRNKQKGWYLHSTVMAFKDGRILKEDFFRNAFFRGFLRQLYLRPSCSSCVYANVNRAADITLGDFWGYQQTSFADRDDDKGVSLVLVNNPNGHDLFERVTLKIRRFNRDLDTAVKYNQALRQPFTESPIRTSFWDDFRKKDLAYVIDKYMFPDELDEWFKMRYQWRYRFKKRWRGRLKRILVFLLGARVCSLLKTKLYNRLRSAWRFCRALKQEFVPLLRERFRHPMIYVFGSPGHSNLGDNAQTLCLQELLKKRYPHYGVRFFSDSHLWVTNFREINFVRWILTKNDKVALHSGYHFTDLYMIVEMLNRKVVQSFPNKPILVFPQTINYLDKNIENESAKIFNAHPNLTLMCRDDVSYCIAQKLFPKCHLRLMPDVVTSLIGRYHYSNPRAGILMCVRNDGEALYDSIWRTALANELENLDKVTITDTTVSDSPKVVQRDLKGYLERVWDEYSRYRLVITDRYHGTIFSLIAGTPVIVISSTDHKLSSGVKWFPKSFSDYVYYAESRSQVLALAKRILDAKLNHILPTYFNDNYYENVFDDIKETWS